MINRHHQHPVTKAQHDNASASVRFAEAVIAGFGSMRYIVIQSVLIVLWIILNVVGLISHWDPYPFILLNLAFSLQAAYAAPLILLGQNRSAIRDRAEAEFDYHHNSESLALLRGIHSDVHPNGCACLLNIPTTAED